MTYPPANSGYPAPQQPGGYGFPAGFPAGPPPAPVAADAGKVPVYLTASVVALGLAAFLASFGPLFSINTDMGPFGGEQLTASGLSYWTVAALVASLLAAVSLLPRARTFTAVAAVAAVLGLLLVIGQVFNRPPGISVGWALWLVLLLTLLQAATAVAALLFETGVLTPPAPRPRYEQYGQYGPPPGGYYGQPGVQGPPPQRPGYPTQYSAGYPSGAPAAGYGPPDTSAPDTPPTGFPSSRPPSSGSSQQPPSPDPSSGSAPGSSQP